MGQFAPILNPSSWFSACRRRMSDTRKSVETENANSFNKEEKIEAVFCKNEGITI